MDRGTKGAATLGRVDEGEIDGGAFEVGGGEERFRLHAREEGDPAVGDAFEPGGELGGDVVVIIARESDALFGLDELAVQFGEGRLRGEVRMGFDDGAEFASDTGVIGAGLAGGGGGRLGAQRGHGGLRGGFVRAQGREGRGERRNEVMTALELNVDQGPGLTHATTEGDEAVEHHPCPREHPDDDEAGGREED